MEFALFIPILLLSIVVHEVAHAWQARREGDRTAEEQGRITLNPLVHLDIWGSVVVPIALWATGGVLLGWAKPVPIDSRNFRDHPWSDIRVSLAGIVSNFILAFGFLLLAIVSGLLSASLPAPVPGALDAIATYGLFINLLLALFNLIPLPPLDGSHVMRHLLPSSLARPYQEFGRFGILVLIGLVLFVPQVFDVILAPVYGLMNASDAVVGYFS